MTGSHSSRLSVLRNGFIHLYEEGPETLRKVVQISVHCGKGLHQNRVFSQAAALAYGTLMALGPLVAVAVLVSTAFIRTDAETQIKNLLVFIAPNLQEYFDLESVSTTDAGAKEMANALDALISQIVTGAESLFSHVNTEGSAAFGIIGILFLIFIVIQLLTAVETNLNQIWGVQQGRPWSQRVVFYWTLVTLGAILGLGATVLFTTSNLVATFEGIPLGGTVTALIIWLGSGVSGIVLSLLLCFFYMFFPHTKVHFVPAMVGGIVTTLLLFLNQYLSILYVQRMISIQSLYGSVGIIPILMLGIYVFWILILLGAQLTYSLQNIEFVGDELTWSGMSHRAKESMSLSVFSLVGQAYTEGSIPPSAGMMAQHLKLPVSVVNESLTILQNLGWIRTTQIEDSGNLALENRYVPSKPLDQLEEKTFREAFANWGPGK